MRTAHLSQRSALRRGQVNVLFFEQAGQWSSVIVGVSQKKASPCDGSAISSELHRVEEIRAEAHSIRSAHRVGNLLLAVLRERIAEVIGAR